MSRRILRHDDSAITTISSVPARAATIHASLASRSSRPVTIVPPVEAPQAQVSVTAWTTSATTVTMPNHRCAREQPVLAVPALELTRT